MVGTVRGYDGVGFVLPELPGGYAVFALDITHSNTGRRNRSKLLLMIATI